MSFTEIVRDILWTLLMMEINDSGKSISMGSADLNGHEVLESL
jgi:hypothetical protein